MNASARSSGVCNGVGDYGQFKRKRSLTSRNEEGLHLGFNIPKALQNTCSGNDVNYESLVKRSETPAAVKAVAENADSNTTSALESRQYIDRVTINLWEHINYTGRFIRLPAAWSICCEFPPAIKNQVKETNKSTIDTITTFAFDSRDENWASSARADPGTKCVLYDNNACRGDSVELTQLGSPYVYL